jgi:hypothetical protein
MIENINDTSDNKIRIYKDEYSGAIRKYKDI